MRDADVRAAVRRVLAERFRDDPETRIVEEMGIWSGAVRIDIAVINGELHGYELKSERDTLERLPAQAQLYNQVFDRVTLVAAERHLAPGAFQIPPWWGVMLAAPTTGGIALREVQAPERNHSVDALQIARLLWRAEALALLKRYGLDRGFRSRTAETIAMRLAERLSLPILTKETRSILKAREGWLGQAVRNKGKMAVYTQPDPCSPISCSDPGILCNLSDTTVGPASSNAAEEWFSHERIGVSMELLWHGSPPRATSA